MVIGPLTKFPRAAASFYLQSAICGRRLGNLDQASMLPP